MAVKKTEEETVKIKITSICSTFAEEVSTYKEAAATTGLSEDEIKASISAGTMVNGYRFKIIG